MPALVDGRDLVAVGRARRTDTDAGGLKAIQFYTLTVENNTAPTITSTAVTSVTAGLNYEYDVQASDADNDALTYALSGAPSWLSIDPNGRITGSPGVAQIGRLRRQPDTHRGRPAGAAASARRNLD